VTLALLLIVGRERSAGRKMFEEVELVVDQAAVKLAHAVGVPEEIRTRVRQVVAGRIRDVVGNLDFLHLTAVDGVRAEIAGDR